MTAKYTEEETDAFLRQANRDLGSGKYGSKQMIQDYARAVIVGKQLLKESKELRAQLKKFEEIEEDRKDRGHHRKQNYIICKNCDRKSFYDYYGHCSVYCCASYAVKHNVLFGDAQEFKFKDEQIDDLLHKIIELKDLLAFHQKMSKKYEDKLEEIEKEKQQQKDAHERRKWEGWKN